LFGTLFVCFISFVRGESGGGVGLYNFNLPAEKSPSVRAGTSRRGSLTPTGQRRCKMIRLLKDYQNKVNKAIDCLAKQDFREAVDTLCSLRDILGTVIDKEIISFEEKISTARLETEYGTKGIPKKTLQSQNYYHLIKDIDISDIENTTVENILRIGEDNEFIYDPDNNVWVS